MENNSEMQNKKNGMRNTMLQIHWTPKKATDVFKATQHQNSNESYDFPRPTHKTVLGRLCCVFVCSCSATRLNKINKFNNIFPREIYFSVREVEGGREWGNQEQRMKTKIIITDFILLSDTLTRNLHCFCVLYISNSCPVYCKFHTSNQSTECISVFHPPLFIKYGLYRFEVSITYIASHRVGTAVLRLTFSQPRTAVIASHMFSLSSLCTASHIMFSASTSHGSLKPVTNVPTISKIFEVRYSTWLYTLFVIFHFWKRKTIFYSSIWLQYYSLSPLRSTCYKLRVTVVGRDLL